MTTIIASDTLAANAKAPSATSTGARYIKDPRSAAAVTRYVSTQWPHIGGADLQPLPDGAFDTEVFRTAYDPGAIAQVYVAGCGEDVGDPRNATGLLGSARRMWMPLYKLSASKADDLRARTADMNLDEYASVIYAPDGRSWRREPGYNNWALQLLHPTRAPLAGSPVGMLPRALKVMLPSTMSLRTFEKQLHAELANAALHLWIKSPSGKRHCREIGIHPSVAKRYTAYNFGFQERISRAEELYVFRPRGGDADRLLTICERIVYEWVLSSVGGGQPRPAWRSRSQGYSARR